MLPFQKKEKGKRINVTSNSFFGFSSNGMMKALFNFALNQVDVFLKKNVITFCDLATCDKYGLISYSGDYLSLLRIKGMRNISTSSEIQKYATSLKTSLSSLFESPGLVMQFYYAADPEGVEEQIAENIKERRNFTSLLNLDFDDIFTERKRFLPPYMRQERIFLAIWTRSGRLTKKEQHDLKKRRKKLFFEIPDTGDGQNPLLGNAELGVIHGASVQRIIQALHTLTVKVEELTPIQALKVIRQEIYPDNMKSDWEPITPQSESSNTIPDDEKPQNIEDALWPPLREQLFKNDALTPNYTTARLDLLDWTSIDVNRFPNRPMPSFTELVRGLADRRMPWRTCITIESVRPTYMSWKKMIATLLKMGSNVVISKAFDELQVISDDKSDSIVRVRMSLATSAKAGKLDQLYTRASRLQQAVESWGGSQAAKFCGDPLAGVLSSVPGLAVASTAPPTAAVLSDIFAVMPWVRPSQPYQNGSVLFRAADGTIVYYDPYGSGRGATLDLFTGPSRRGKSVLANSLLLGTVLSPAASTTDGIKLPLIGKLDIGDSSSGFVDMIQTALRPEDQHLALYIKFDLLNEKCAYNIFSTETCCRYPLEHHKNFLENFLNLAFCPLDGKPFEGMDQIISDVIRLSYKLYDSKTSSNSAKSYRRKCIPEIDTILDKDNFLQNNSNVKWWDVADYLSSKGDMKNAYKATQQAVPVIGDLAYILKEESIKDKYINATPTSGSENLIDIFRRYLSTFIQRYPILNKPTKLDIGDSRIVVIDIDKAAPEGQGEAQRQTELMYMLGYYIVARNFFLDPDETDRLPENVRDWHKRRFQEFKESFKRLECDEFQRTAGAPPIQKQFEDSARRGAKLNVKIGLASQKLSDYGEYLISHSTGRFILGAGDEDEANEICDRFKLSDAARQITRHGLNGPQQDGSGSPFILKIMINNEWYELYLLNLMGPMELWALSTTPLDIALRRRLYDSLGTHEARKRLGLVFPKGTAVTVINHMKEAAIKKAGSLDSDEATSSVIDKLADDICNARGLGAALLKERPTIT